jgi:hypothetical protein
MTFYKMNQAILALILVLSATAVEMDIPSKAGSLPLTKNGKLGTVKLG